VSLFSLFAYIHRWRHSSTFSELAAETAGIEAVRAALVGDQMKLPLVLVFLLALPICANAADVAFPASSLQLLCSPAPSLSQQDRDNAETVCSAYLMGLTDAMFLMQSLADVRRLPCMPKEVAIGLPEAKRLFQNYLIAHPDTRNNSAALVAGMAIADAFKCGRSN
jgi:hypothetical protein